MKSDKVVSAIKAYLDGCFQNPSIQHQHLAGLGPTFLLEEKLRSYYNKKYAVAFTNATTCMSALCLALDLHDSEIITSPINWGSSIAPFLLHDNKLRFVSFDSLSLNLMPGDLSSGLTSKTKAVLSVDYNGLPANSKVISAFCKSNGLHYISDSAQSLGAYYDKKPAGYFADVIVLSFSPGKSIYGGEGGAVLTNSKELFEKLLYYSQHPLRQKMALGLNNYNLYSPINARINPLSAILLNETFESSLAALKIYQSQCFELLKQLLNENLIKEPSHITSPDSSTFFNFSLQLKTNANLQQVKDFLYKHKQPFEAIQSLPQLIPFDASFKKQFKGKFFCTKNLLRQKSSYHFNDRITLVHSHFKNQT